MRIDAHQHFWRYSEAAYPWIDARFGVLRRDYLPADLAPALAAGGMEGTLAVQARASLLENDFLLGLARENPLVRGVIGWVDLCSPTVGTELERLAREPLFKGVRHLVQDEPDDGFLLRADFQRGLARLQPLALAYDLLVFPRHLEAAAALVARFPGQVFVLDHLAKPSIGRGAHDDWERGLRALARHPGVSCKLSGLVTEARWQAWKPADFRVYLDVALEAFGPARLLYGSDWPVCLLGAASYAEVLGLLADWAGALAPSERDALFGANAQRIYRLP